MNTIRSEASARKALRSMTALAMAILGVAAAMPASAQQRPSGWQYEYMGYTWTTSLKGQVQTPGLPPTNVDVSFSDLFENLDLAYSAAFEARNGRWGILADLQYYKLSVDGSTSRTGPLGNTLTVNGEVTVQQTLLSAAGAYRVVEGAVPLDVIAGARYTKLKVDLDTDLTALGLSSSTNRNGSKDWVDPYVGMRVRYPLSDRWAVSGYGDIGGFGVGSEFTWQLRAGMEYQFSNKYTVRFGYRIMDVDYEKNGFVYDMKTDGLYFGVGAKF